MLPFARRSRRGRGSTGRGAGRRHRRAARPGEPFENGVALGRPDPRAGSPSSRTPCRQGAGDAAPHRGLRSGCEDRRGRSKKRPPQRHHRKEHPLPPARRTQSSACPCSSRARRRCGRAVRCAELTNLAQAEQLPLGVLAACAHGFDERQVRVLLVASLAYRPLHVHHLKQYCKLQRQSRICRPYISLTDQGPGEANFLISGLWPSREAFNRGVRR